MSKGFRYSFIVYGSLIGFTLIFDLSNRSSLFYLTGFSIHLVGYIITSLNFKKLDFDKENLISKLSPIIYQSLSTLLVTLVYTLIARSFKPMIAVTELIYFVILTYILKTSYKVKQSKKYYYHLLMAIFIFLLSPILVYLNIDKGVPISNQLDYFILSNIVLLIPNVIFYLINYFSAFRYKNNEDNADFYNF